ncbi:hypothetical protein [Anianabacter salinae]|uniref:hypothetical protein n=1 Tax=Anianabacter salinae TaxID=2851023 RepID=UPI00225E54FE|nr:hypothetical protein [Anianabacter salinae]MBV0912918.1 hypothetical protein [Anianabacter salinae]
MTETPASAEATLLYSDPLGVELSSLVEGLDACLAQFDQPILETRFVREEYLILYCPDVQVLAARCPVPLDLDQFEGVTRPDGDNDMDHAVLSMLEDHAESLTVIVTVAPEHGARTSRADRLEICCEVADLLAEETHADLVFWCDTDTLFTADEFARANLSFDDNVFSPPLLVAAPRAVER